MEKGFNKKLLKLVIPLALQSFMFSLIGASDALMLGGLSQDALSAVSLATQITFVFNILMSAINIGENLHVAQFIGDDNKNMVKATMAIVIRFVLILSTVVGLSAVLMPEVLMRIFTSEDNLIILGGRYLRIAGISYIFSGIGQVLLTLMKNTGYPKTTTVFSLIMVLSNIGFNAIFIFCCNMGIEGAALATVIANVIAFTIGITFSYLKLKEYVGFKDLFYFNRAFERSFWKIESKVMFNIIGWGIGYTMYTVILGHMGNDAVAANSIANITKNSLICVCDGFSGAGAIIIGNYLGANRLDEAKTIGSKLVKISIISGLITGLIILASIPLILLISNISETADHYLLWMLVISSYYVAGKSVNCMVIPGIFAAGGDTKFGMICDTATMWVVTVPLGLLAAFVFRLPVLLVYFIINIDEVIKLPVVYMHYKKYKWIKNITKESTTYEEYEGKTA